MGDLCSGIRLTNKKKRTIRTHHVNESQNCYHLAVLSLKTRKKEPILLHIFKTRKYEQIYCEENRSMVSGDRDEQGGEDGITEGTGQFWGDKFSIMTWSYVTSNQVAHLKYVQFIVC